MGVIARCPELPLNMGEYILNNLKNIYFSPFKYGTTYSGIKALQNFIKLIAE